VFRSLSLRALLAAAAVFLSAGAFLAPAAHAQATRTWVSGVGDDVNPCSRTAPCKTFAGAISKTAANGEIDALDSGGFGAVTITKAVTIDASNVEGGIVFNAGSGVTVNAGAGDDVTLRGLDFNGLNAGTGCTYATTGVRVLSAGSVRIEDSTLDRNQKAVDISPTSKVDVFIDRVDIGNSCAQGIKVTPGAGGSANVMIQDSTITNSGVALSVADNGTAWLTRTTVFGNALGLQALGTGAINDFGDNRLAGNTDDGAATTDLDPPTPLPAAVAGPMGPQGAQGVQGTQGVHGEPALKLLLAPSQSSVAFKAGKQVTLGYAATAAATSTLTILKGTKKIATVTGSSKVGANTIKWNGKAGRKAATAGAYKLTLSAVGTDGQSATTTVALKLKR
jgi:hypothetical protein